MNISNRQIRDMFRRIAVGEGNHGAFLKSFGLAVINADEENLELLRPLALALMEKYDLVNKHPEEFVKRESLGTCCICGGLEDVRNIINLPYKALTPGHGWGCVVCGLPPDGAIAVLCDGCLEADPPKGLKFACDDFPAANKRVPIGELSSRAVSHEHDMAKHGERYGFTE
jgi:hypothetical protein